MNDYIPRGSEAEAFTGRMPLMGGQLDGLLPLW